jgi:hypothetical protein
MDYFILFIYYFNDSVRNSYYRLTGSKGGCFSTYEPERKWMEAVVAVGIPAEIRKGPLPTRTRKRYRLSQLLVYSSG